MPYVPVRTVVPGWSQSLRCTDKMSGASAPPVDQNKVIRTRSSKKCPLGCLPRVSDGDNSLVTGSRYSGRNRRRSGSSNQTIVDHDHLACAFLSAYFETRVEAMKEGDAERLEY